MTTQSRVPGLNAAWPCAAPFSTCGWTRTDNILQGCVLLFMRLGWQFSPCNVWLGMSSALFCEGSCKISMISSVNAEWSLRGATCTWSPSGQEFSHRSALSDRAVVYVTLRASAAWPLQGLPCNFSLTNVLFRSALLDFQIFRGHSIFFCYLLVSSSEPSKPENTHCAIVCFMPEPVAAAMAPRAPDRNEFSAAAHVFDKRSTNR